MYRDAYALVYSVILVCLLLFIGSVIAMFNVKQEDMLFPVGMAFFSIALGGVAYKTLKESKKDNQVIEPKQDKNLNQPVWPNWPHKKSSH